MQVSGSPHIRQFLLGQGYGKERGRPIIAANRAYGSRLIPFFVGHDLDKAARMTCFPT